MDLSFILQLVDLPKLAVEYPVLTKIFVIIGVMRIVMKPLFALLMKYVDIQPSLASNQKVMNLLRSPIWKSIAFGIDMVFSVKLPFAPGSVGFQVQQAVVADKGDDPTPPAPTPAAGV